MKKVCFSALLLCLFLFNCDVNENPVSANNTAVTTRFAVISDLHYYDASLGITGSAFANYVSHDRKLIAESGAILQSVIGSLSSENLDFVIIPGDLTKDGELVNHQKMADYLRILESRGKKVYVIPGNHDINNPRAVKYNDSTTQKVSTITPEQFSQIYSDYGYNDAIERDPNSLSYVVEPVKGIYLIGMDASRYRENSWFSISSGKFSQATLLWIVEKIKEAKSKNKFVIGFMHQNILEHFTSENEIIPGYVIINFNNVSRKLADAGMNIIFTGHNHCQDIVSKTFDKSFLYDIETGSLATYPNPYRIITIADSSTMIINSKRVEKINYDTGEKSFQEYSKNLLINNIKNNNIYYLMFAFGFNRSLATFLAPYAATTLLANAEGDESPNSEIAPVIQTLKLTSNTKIANTGYYFKSLWIDLPPADNDIVINLKNGTATNLNINKMILYSGF